MTVGPVRMARLRDLLLLWVSTIAAICSTILLVGWIWFKALFFSAMGGLTLPLGYLLALTALLAGALYVWSPPPCRSDREGRIRES